MFIMYQYPEEQSEYNNTLAGALFFMTLTGQFKRVSDLIEQHDSCSRCSCKTNSTSLFHFNGGLLLTFCFTIVFVSHDDKAVHCIPYVHYSRTIHILLNLVICKLPAVGCDWQTQHADLACIWKQHMWAYVICYTVVLLLCFFYPVIGNGW